MAGTSDGDSVWEGRSTLRTLPGGPHAARCWSDRLCHPTMLQRAPLQDSPWRIQLVMSGFLPQILAVPPPHGFVWRMAALTSPRAVSMPSSRAARLLPSRAPPLAPLGQNDADAVTCHPLHVHPEGLDSQQDLLQRLPAPPHTPLGLLPAVFRLCPDAPPPDTQD